MDKRQGVLAAVLGLAIMGGLVFWWTTREQEAPVVAAPVTATSANALMTATVAAPLTSAPTAATAPASESDAVALSEEVIDQIRKEGEELGSRAIELEAQVKDGAALIALKEKQLRELEEQLKQIPAGSAK